MQRKIKLPVWGNEIMSDDFLTTYNGLLEGVLSDTQYKSLCECVHGDWFSIEVSSEEKIVKSISGEEVKSLMFSLLDIIQKRNMVSSNYPYTYAKNIQDPILIKVYDPMKCGSSCSTSSPDPWWIFTKIKPEDDELMTLFPKKNTKKFFGLLKV